MPEPFPAPVLTTSAATANRAIWIVSFVVFSAVALLSRVQVPAPSGIDVLLFAKLNAVINTTVSLLLLAGLLSAKSGRWQWHRLIMGLAMILSACFLVSYILHHLFAGETKFGGQGPIRLFYYAILISHILLAAGSLPFILMTAYRALSGKYPQHASLARKVWPVWFYVSVSGVVVYWMISPYY
jgi:putative membrane protein